MRGIHDIFLMDALRLVQQMRQLRHAGRDPPRPGTLDFVRIDFSYGRDRSTFFLTSLHMVGTNPGFDGTTSDKRHIKHVP